MDGFVLNQLCSALNAKKTPATLKEVSYECQILNNILKTKMTQTFRSVSSKEYSESFYEITVQEGTCLEHFSAMFEDKIVTGVIKSKKNAIEEYNQAKTQGSLVSYAEVHKKSSSEELIKVRLGNLPPDSDVQIVISFSRSVDSLLNSFYVVRIPMIYVENNESKTKSSKPLFNLELICTGYITFCESKGYPATAIDRIDSNTYKITLHEIEANTNIQPFTLIYGYEGMFEPQVVFGASKVRVEDTVKQGIMPIRESVYVSFLPGFNQDFKEANKLKTQQSHEGEGTVMEVEALGRGIVSESIKDKVGKCADIWSDEFKSKICDELVDYMDVSKSEFIFLLDRSGSMSGQSLTRAIQALTLFLQSLPTDSYFNVISFGSTFHRLFPSSRRYNKASLSQAISVIAQYPADLAGTEIFEPLEDVLLKQERIENYNKQVFLLTDGEVSRPEEVIEFVKSHCNHARVHAIGFGSEADRYLIEESAKAGKGLSKIVDFSDDLSEVVVCMLKGSLTATLDDFELEYEESVFESAYPDVKSLPCVLKDEIFNLHLFVKPLKNLQDLSEVEKTVKISYFDSKKNERVQQMLKLQTSDSNLCNEELRESAFRLGKQLQLNRKILENNAMKSQKSENGQDKAEREDEIVAESLDYQILNNLTAMICVISILNDASASQFKETQHEVAYYPGESIMMEREDSHMKLISCIASSPQYQANVLNQDAFGCGGDDGDIPLYDYQSEGMEVAYCLMNNDGISLTKQKEENNGGEDEDDNYEDDDDDEQSKSKGKREKDVQIAILQDISELDSIADEEQLISTQSVKSLEELLSEVDSYGMWNYNEQTCLEYLQMEELLRFRSKFDENYDVFMTVVVLAILNAFFSSEKTKWSLIAKKGASWVKAHTKIDNLELIQEEILNAVRKENINKTQN